MPTAARYGSTKRFGPRYGRKIKEKVGKIEEARRASTLCPYCRKHKVKRLAAGIWQCGKCDSTFTGRAYVVGRKTTVSEQLSADEPESAPEDDEEEEAEQEENTEETK